MKYCRRALAWKAAIGKGEAATNQMEINTYMKHNASHPAPTPF